MTEYRIEFEWSGWRVLLKTNRRRVGRDQLPERVRAAVDAAIAAGSWGELLRTCGAGEPEPDVSEEAA